MYRYMFAAFILIFLSSCSAATNTPDIPLPSPTALFMEASAPTSSTDIYEQNIHLFDYDAEPVVEITESDVRQEVGYAVHDISYPSPKAGDVPAYLVVPEGSGPFAAVILMHGSSGSRESLLPFAEDIVKTGAVALTISGPAARIPGRSWITFTPQDRNEQIQLMVDLRRAVDVLARYEKVDPARIGYIGYSYGAAMGGLLAGIEPRIKAYGLMVGDGGLVNHFTDGDQPVGGFETIDAATRQKWLEAMEPIEPIHYIGHSSSAVFFQNANLDMLVSKEDALAYQSAGNEPKKIQWYDSGHGLPTEAYVDMVDWLAEQIGTDPSKFKLTS